MTDTGIMTSQHVRIEQPVASMGHRMAAQLIDWMVVLAYETAMVYLFTHIHDQNPYVYIVFLGAPLLFYSLAMEVLNNGQSLGKMVMKTRVVMADGTTPPLSSYLLRWLLFLVDGPTMSCLGIVVMAVTARNQRLGDLAAGTVVIKLGAVGTIQQSLDQYDYLSHGYTPRYVRADELSLEQIDVIARALSLGGDERLSQLSEKVQLRLGTERREPTDAAFLQRVVRDYQYYALEDV